MEDGLGYGLIDITIALNMIGALTFCLLFISVTWGVQYMVYWLMRSDFFITMYLVPPSSIGYLI